MYYNYLNREQQYLKSYRTHNLWFDQYQKKVRSPRIAHMHISFMKRMGKSYSGVSILIFTFILIIHYLYPIESCYL